MTDHAQRAACKLYRQLNAQMTNTVALDDESLSRLVSMEIHLIHAALTQAHAAGRREGLEEAAKIALHYNCDHDHGKAATKACDEVEELIRAKAKEGL